MIPHRKTHPILQPSTNIIYDLPAPQNLSLIWNSGSILGLCLTIQITTGLLLTIHYSPDTTIAFSTISHTIRDVTIGWILKYIHINGASIIFLIIYIHIGRRIYFNSYKRIETWNLGVLIYIIVIATAFIGYLLPWGQIRFWGATVITNIFSAIPYVGISIVTWLWGGFAVSNPTLTRFFTLHFLTPFLIRILALLHLIFLHASGSNNPLGLSSNYNKISFHPFFSWKDIWGFTALILILLLSLLSPNTLNDPENFIPANPLITPTHIKPEWYFLWAYAILRSIPNKLGGVIIIFTAILILFLLPINNKTSRSRTNITRQQHFWLLITSFLILTWIGNSPVEEPYTYIGILSTITYFILIILNLLPTLPLKPPHLSS